jgi:hypothetical protein
MWNMSRIVGVWNTGNHAGTKNVNLFLSERILSEIILSEIVLFEIVLSLRIVKHWIWCRHDGGLDVLLWMLNDVVLLKVK